VIGGASVHPGSSEPAVFPTRRSLPAVEEYDPATNTWARNHAAMGVVG